MQTTTNKIYAYIQSFRPLSHGQAFAIKNKNVIIIPVILLLFHCSPSTIFFAIIFVAFNSFKGMFKSWFHSHIFQKISKGVAPSITYGYSFCSIVFKTIIFGIITSIYHSSPCRIFRGCFCSCRTTMLWITHNKFEVPARKQLMEAAVIKRGLLRLISLCNASIITRTNISNFTMQKSYIK